VVALEGELSQREADLESLLAKQNKLKNQTDLATVTVHLVTPGQGRGDRRERATAGGFTAGLGGGWDAFTAAAVGAATVLGAVAAVHGRDRRPGPAAGLGHGAAAPLADHSFHHSWLTACPDIAPGEMSVSYAPGRTCPGRTWMLNCGPVRRAVGGSAVLVLALAVGQPAVQAAPLSTAPITSLISLGVHDKPSAGAELRAPRSATDGRYVAFDSDADKPGPRRHQTRRTTCSSATGAPGAPNGSA